MYVICAFTYTVHETLKQYSLLDTIFSYVRYVGSRMHISGKIKNIYCNSAVFVGRHVVVSGPLSIDISLEI